MIELVEKGRAAFAAAQNHQRGAVSETRQRIPRRCQVRHEFTVALLQAWHRDFAVVTPCSVEQRFEVSHLLERIKDPLTPIGELTLSADIAGFSSVTREIELFVSREELETVSPPCAPTLRCAE